MERSIEELRLMRAAAELRLPYGVVLRKVLTGELKGGQRDGKWFVEAESVRRLRDQRQPEPASAA